MLELLLRMLEEFLRGDFRLEAARDEMVVATLDAAMLQQEREHPNYQLRTRRPELFGQISEKQPPG